MGVGGVGQVQHAGLLVPDPVFGGGVDQGVVGEVQLIGELGGAAQLALHPVLVPEADVVQVGEVQAGALGDHLPLGEGGEDFLEGGEGGGVLGLEVLPRLGGGGDEAGDLHGGRRRLGAQLQDLPLAADIEPAPAAGNAGGGLGGGDADLQGAGEVLDDFGVLHVGQLALQAFLLALGGGEEEVVADGVIAQGQHLLLAVHRVAGDLDIGHLEQQEHAQQGGDRRHGQHRQQQGDPPGGFAQGLAALPGGLPPGGTPP